MADLPTRTSGNSSADHLADHNTMHALVGELEELTSGGLTTLHSHSGSGQFPGTVVTSQSELASAISSPGRVWISGSFAINSSLSPVTGVEIFGVNGATLIAAASNIDIFRLNGINNVRVDGVSFNGMKGSYSNTRGLWMQNVSDIQVVNSRFIDTYENGIYIGTSTDSLYNDDISIVKNRFKGCGAADSNHNISAFRNTRHLKIALNHFEESGYQCNGVRISRSSHYPIVFGNTFNKTGDWAIELWGDLPTVTHSMTFAASDDSITLSVGSFEVDEWVAGETIKVYGTSSNDGTYTIASRVSSTKITLVEALSDETSGAYVTNESQNQQILSPVVANNTINQGNYLYTNGTGGSPSPSGGGISFDDTVNGVLANNTAYSTAKVNFESAKATFTNIIGNNAFGAFGGSTISISNISRGVNVFGNSVRDTSDVSIDGGTSTSRAISINGDLGVDDITISDNVIVNVQRGIYFQNFKTDLGFKQRARVFNNSIRSGDNAGSGTQAGIDGDSNANLDLFSGGNVTVDQSGTDYQANRCVRGSGVAAYNAHYVSGKNFFVDYAADTTSEETT